MQNKYRWRISLAYVSLTAISASASAVRSRSYDALSQLPSKSFKADVSLRETLAQKRFEKGADTAAQWASEAEEELERCLICLEEMQPKAVLCSLTCEHTFHADCLDGWLQRSSQCPTCRVQLCVLDGELAHEIELA